MSILDDPMTSDEVEVDMTVRESIVSAQALNDYRRDNRKREYLTDNFSHIEKARDLLSAVLDDVQGKH